MRCAFSAVLVLGLAGVAVGQKAPEAGYLFPPTVQRGTTVDVQLGGYDLTPDVELFVHDPRLKLTLTGPLGDFLIPPPPYWFGEKGRRAAFPIAREIPARVSAPADFAPGSASWQLANANGGSVTAVLYVSDRREIVERRYRDQPQTLGDTPLGVSGRLQRIAEVDRYRFTAKRTGPITVELFARRFGAALNGVLEVRDKHDRVIADAADTQGLDTALTFAARANQSYTIRLHDIDFRGNRAYVYRLAVTAGPRVVATIPAAVRRGETRRVDFVGYGVDSGAAKLETTTRTVTAPNDRRLNVWRYRLETPHGRAPPIEIPMSELPDRVVGEVRNATKLQAPCAVTAVMSEAQAATFPWTANKGQPWNISAESRAVGTNLDLELTILDAEGKQLAANDDLPGTSDAGLSFTPPADGTYRCVVRDLSGRPADAASVYRLSLRLDEPSFSLIAPPLLNLPIGGKAELPIKVERRGGFNDPITVAVQGLPKGVAVEQPLTIAAGKNELKAPLTVAADAACAATLIQIVGTATIGGQTVAVNAEAPVSGNLCPRDPSSQRTSHVLLATTLAPRFRVKLIDKNRQRAVHRGTTYPAPFRIERDTAFDRPVQLQMAARQGRHRQGIRGPVIAVGPKGEQALYPCFMPQWLETDRTTRMVVMGVAQQADPRGNLRYVTQLADARVTMILEGALLSVSHQAPELTVRPGDSFEIPLTISRSAKLQTPVTVELTSPDELAGLVKFQPTRLSVKQGQARLRVETVADKKLIGRWTFQVVATTHQNEKWPVVSQTDLTVEFSGR